MLRVGIRVSWGMGHDLSLILGKGFLGVHVTNGMKTVHACFIHSFFCVVNFTLNLKMLGVCEHFWEGLCFFQFSKECLVLSQSAPGHGASRGPILLRSSSLFPGEGWEPGVSPCLHNSHDPLKATGCTWRLTQRWESVHLPSRSLRPFVWNTSLLSPPPAPLRTHLPPAFLLPVLHPHPTDRRGPRPKARKQHRGVWTWGTNSQPSALPATPPATPLLFSLVPASSSIPRGLKGLARPALARPQRDTFAPVVRKRNPGRLQGFYPEEQEGRRHYLEGGRRSLRCVGRSEVRSRSLLGT